MYSESFAANNPGCIVLLIDQSHSMRKEFAGVPGTSKAEECAAVVNRLLREIALSCQKGDEIRERCYVGLIGYGGASVSWAFQGELTGRELVSIAEVAAAPLRIAEVMRTRLDATGRRVQVPDPYPVWLEPVTSGDTPMAEAFELAATALRTWVAQHPKGFPPVIINITDGVPSNQPRARLAAEALRAIRTSDGAALLLNAHISTSTSERVALPASADALPRREGGVNEEAALLFEMSSVLPEPLRASAKMQGFSTTDGSRGFVYNADAEMLVRVLTFGSAPALPG